MPGTARNQSPRWRIRPSPMHNSLRASSSTMIAMRFRLVRRYQSAVRTTLRRLTAGNHALADDIAQETFMLAYRNLKSFARGQVSTGFIGSRPTLSRRRPQAEGGIAGRSRRGHRGRRGRRRCPVTVPVGRTRRGTPRCASTWSARCPFLRTRNRQRSSAIMTVAREAAVVLNCPVGTVKTHICGQN